VWGKYARYAERLLKNWEAQTYIGNRGAVDPLAVSLEKTSIKRNYSDNSQSYLNNHSDY
jgi:hypothetical protein